MRVIIHNLLHGSEQQFTGDRYTVLREIGRAYPWYTEHVKPGDLETALALIDQQQYLAVEVADDKEHPLAV